ncbi:MAG: type II toxin-antitoxin system RatA family toxin [Hyphomicrobiales bacterium]
MGTFSATRHLPFSARQLFDLAADVAEYPKFVPLCKEARIWDEVTHEDGVKEFEAALVVAYDKLNIREEFISEVRADPDALLVTSHANTGPVKKLTSTWAFEDTPKHGGTNVTYNVDFKMRSIAMQLVMDAAFKVVVDKVMNAFEARANELYKS